MKKIRFLVLLGAAVLVSACESMPQVQQDQFMQGLATLRAANQPVYRPMVTCVYLGSGLTTCQ